MPPKAVVFDLGKVLVEFDYAIAASKLEPMCAVPAAELKAAMDQSPLLYRYETGLISTDQFFAEVQKHAGFRGDITAFGELFADIFTSIESMVALHSSVRSRGFPTYLFSNTNPLATQHIRQRFPFFDFFNGYVLSYEHGAMKPDPKLYEVVEKLARRRGPELLYIDDRPENIATGISRGWQSILHIRPEETIEAVRRTGILGKEQPGSAR